MVYPCVTKKERRQRGPVWFAKLDVRHYFSSIDQEILLRILSRRVTDPQLFELCRRVITSFGVDGRGLPLGNLTSQWFANIYLHELDWFVKHELRVQNYMRYNDDIIVLVRSETAAREIAYSIQRFVFEKLQLMIPENKITIDCVVHGLDVLGLNTNGNQVWLRRTTVNRARTRLIKQWSNNEPTLLDAACSYAALAQDMVSEFFI